MKTEIFLRIPNPAIMVQGRARERLKAERPTQAYSRYYEMLKQRKEQLEKEKPPEIKQPRILRPVMGVSNPQSPIIQARSK